MTRYLLDTNVLSALLRDPRGSLLGKIQAVGETSVYTSVIVAGELRFGAVKKGSDRLEAAVEAILARITVAPIEPPVDRLYAGLRWHLQAKGELIGGNDLWIAAQALQDESVVVTANIGEFERVPNLKVENWASA